MAAESVASATGACVPGSDPCLPPTPCHSSLHTLCPGWASGSTNSLRLLPSLTALLPPWLLSWLLPLAGGWAVLGVPFPLLSSSAIFFA